MKPTIIPADTAGKIVSWDNGNDVYYVGSSCPPIGNGVCYKNKKAFDDGVGICYINEYSFFDEVGIDENVSDEMLAWMQENNEWYVAQDNGYTRDDIVQAVEQWIADSNMSFRKDIYDQFVEYVAAYVFQTVDWQCPETFLSEIDVADEYDTFCSINDDARLTPQQAKELAC